jgi:hypothetical protein
VTVREPALWERALLGLLSPQFFEFPLEMLGQQLRCVDEGLQGHFRVRPRLKRQGRLQQDLEEAVAQFLFNVG